MNSPVYLYMPSFDQTKILTNRKKDNVFKRSIKIIGNITVNNMNCDKNLLHDIEFLKKVRKNEEKEPDPTPIKSNSNKKLPKIKLDKPSEIKNDFKKDLSSFLQVKKVSNLTNISYDCFKDSQEKKEKFLKCKCTLRSAFLRNNLQSASLKSLNFYKKPRVYSSVVKNTFSFKKMEWEYSSKLKYIDEKSIIGSKIRIVKTPNTNRK